MCIIVFFSVLKPSAAQQWNTLGSENQVSSVASFYTSITVLNDVPYVVYVEGTSSGGIGKVKRRNGTTGIWEQVGGTLSANNVSYTRIFSDKNNKLYVTFLDNANSSRLCILFFNTATQVWEPLISGNPFVSAVSANHSSAASIIRNGLSFDKNNVLYISYSERTATTGYPFVKRFVNGAWQTLGGGAVSADWAVGNNIAIDSNNVPYTVYVQQASSAASTGVIKTFRFNATTNSWVDVSPPNPVTPGSTTTGATTSVRHTSIALDSSYNPIVSYFNTTSNSKSTVIRYNKSTTVWDWLGAPSTRDAPNNTLINDDAGNIYNSFTDALIGNGLSGMVRVFKLYRGSANFIELKNATSNRGIDSTGDNSTVARSISIANLSIAVGSDTSKPFIVYTKTNSANIITPVVKMFSRAVITKPVINIDSTSAVTGGEISSDGVSVIVQRGIVYSHNANPTLADSVVIDPASGFGSYNSVLTGLSVGTAYHVRAYSISSTNAVVYGNDLFFGTTGPDSNSVTVIDSSGTVIMNNGIVRATISKSSARVISLIYNGLELMKGDGGTGAVYWSWNMPDYQELSGCTYTLTTDPHSNNFNYGEVKLHMSWNNTAATAAMDVDVYYSLPKNTSGLYASATLTHPSSYPALPGGEWRMSSYPNYRFNWLTVDSLRSRLMPTPYDFDNADSVAGAPKEVYRLTTGTFANQYECKYDYSADFGDINTWGWSSTVDKVGLWVTAPSKEYYPGGPKKKELMCHGSITLLNMIGGTHFGQGQETSVAAGETWQKTYGPFLLYCNKVPAAIINAPQALWTDAKNQALAEQASWPYSWFTNPSYIKEIGRGTVTGTLVINDTGNTAASAANTWIGLAVAPTGSSSATDFQSWSKNYQFWIKTGANGSFTIPHVLPGTYSLFAFGPGAIGQLSLVNYVTVTAGNTTALGNITWAPSRVAPTVWQIGTPDRNAGEYRHKTDWWVGNFYPNPNWAKFMDYPSEFPNDVNFTIGQSSLTTDWNFVHYWDKSFQTVSPVWNVKFNLASAPTAGTTASLYVALAENKGAALILSVNGTNVTIPSTGVPLSNFNSNAMIRKGTHGAFTEVRFNFPASLLNIDTNQISLKLRVTGTNIVGDVMYDYLRLEAQGVPQSVVLGVDPVLRGTRAGSKNLLTWDGKMAEKNIECEVLRGKKPDVLTSIGAVAVKDGYGNNGFGFTDHAPCNGDNYYCISFLQANGKKTFSNTIRINNAEQSNSLLVYPNPVSDQLTISTTSGTNIASLRLSDMKGATILAKENITSSQTVINVNSLPAGLYILEVQIGSDKISRLVYRR